ncbi:cytochrome c [Pseudovibrio sp. Tun.PSC04-5.I4]|uniref:c-type cytochrome n=1 Tax=Pseudovibrio sp. Tun.PSC04-5.I4 TaxID=1798213 RepID=UPI00087F5A2B|nr:cytochrome c [Pseudovibrio sp. Tun.PSC04-5.I4]SDR47652.1 Cytochrome c556 [Pseudovibrio sp. Tun.PSC04-5.I4]
MRKLLITALVAMTATSAFAEGVKKEDVVDARRAYYTLLGYDMGTLAAMAKGNVDYNADTAKAAAANMMTVANYNAAGLYVPGTSNADLPGKTRALPVIWEDMPGMQAKGKDFYQALVALNEAAGGGRPALGKAVMKLGGTCKACHSHYRAKDF